MTVRYSTSRPPGEAMANYHAARARASAKVQTLLATRSPDPVALERLQAVQDAHEAMGLEFAQGLPDEAAAIATCRHLGFADGVGEALEDLTTKEHDQ